MDRYWRKPWVLFALFVLVVIVVKVWGQAKLAPAAGISANTLYRAHELASAGQQPAARPRADADDQPGTASELEAYT